MPSIRKAARATYRAFCLGVIAVVALAIVGGLVTNGVGHTPAPTLPQASADGEAVIGRSAAPGAVPAALVPGTEAGSGGLGICPSTGGNAIAEERYLPVNRWSSAAGDIHTRLSADFWNDVGQKTQRNMVDSTFLSIGNSMWSAAASLTSFASRFCVGEAIGYKVDAGAAAIGDAIMGNPDESEGSWLGSGPVIPMVLMVLLIGTVLWRKARGTGGSWKQVSRAAITIAVMMSLLLGARGTDSSGPDAGSFGTGSPGWWASRVNLVISGMASAPAMALNEQVTNGDNQLAGLASAEPDDVTSCQNYLYTLREKYQDSYSTSSLAAISTAAVPMSMDSMWQTSGMSAYINTQFGTDNDMGERVFCRQLEYNSGTSPEEHMKWTTGETATSGPEFTTTVDAQPWQPYDNSGVDRAVISFAVCKWNGSEWVLAPGWDTVTNGSKSPDPGECEDTFEEADKDTDNEDFFFEWSDDAQNIMDGTSEAPQARDFLLAYHGNVSPGGGGPAFMYMIVSLVILAVFGLLSFAVIGAKIGLWVMVLFVFVALLANLFSREHGADRAVAYVKQYCGMALFAFGAALLLSSIALVTAILQGVGTSFGDNGSILSIVWMGLSPVIAIMVIRFIFKELLKAPDPLRPSSGFAYAAAAGGMGGAAFHGLDRMFDRGSSKAKSSATGSAKKVANAGYGKVTQGPGKKERSGGMEPTAGRVIDRRGAGAGKGGVAAGGATAQATAATGGSAAQRRRAAERLQAARTSTDKTEDALHTHDANVESAENAPTTGAGQELKGRAKVKEGARLQREAIGGRSENGGPASRTVNRARNRATVARKSSVDSVRLAASKFANKPIRNTAKGAVVLGGLTALPGAAPVAIGGAAALYGANRLRRRVHDNPQIKDRRQQERLGAYTRQQKLARARKEREVLLAEREEQKAHDDAAVGPAGDGTPRVNDGGVPDAPDGGNAPNSDKKGGPGRGDDSTFTPPPASAWKDTPRGETFPVAQDGSRGQ